MPPKKNKQRKNKGEDFSPVYEMSPKCIEYWGPVTNSFFANESRPYTTLCNQTQNVVSSGGGVITTVCTVNPNTLALANWSNLVLCFDEYRILAWQVKYIPTWSSIPAGTNGGFVVSVIDHDSAIALTTMAGGCQYESSKITSIDRRFTQTWRMSSTLESEFQNSSATINQGSIKMWGTGFSNTITYGTLFIKALIQFRGKGV